MDKYRVLICDDEKAITDIIKFNLEKDGYDVDVASDGEAGISAVLASVPDLMLLDIMMPKKDGLTVLRELRQNYSFPIIMVTAKEEEIDKIIGLELGADDYVVKPFSMRELLARIKANLRRVDIVDHPELPVENEIIRYKNLEIDLQKYEVRKDGKIVDLTLREFELLRFMAKSKGQVFSREQLLEDVWGYEYYGDIRTVDVTIRRIRGKLENEGEDAQYILTKRGIGYYFGG